MDAQLVLLRHGHSEWNISNRFTGWTDIALTEQGLNEATQAGQQLREAGWHFDEIHISVLQRTRQTADSLLQAMQHPPVPVLANWRLNERHYGALQGLNKQEIFTAWGEEQSFKWWRGYAERPPALDENDPRHPRFDALYQALPAAHLPATESLADCLQRLLPYWNEILVPRIQAQRRVLLISHGNTLRSLLMHLQELSPRAVESLEIPSAVPLLCHLDQHGKLIQLQEGLHGSTPTT